MSTSIIIDASAFGPASPLSKAKLANWFVRHVGGNCQSLSEGRADILIRLIVCGSNKEKLFRHKQAHKK